MTITTLLIPYGVLLIPWIILSLMLIWNLFSYIKEMPAAALLMMVYLIGSAVILAVSWFFISSVEWRSPLTIF